MTSRSVKVRVPATIGNFLGDAACGALALDAVMNVTATLRRDGNIGIRYFGDSGERVPRDRSNLIVQALESAIDGRNRHFGGADLEIYSSIPVGVGLGASTAAVWAGLIAADRLFELGLEEKTFLELAGQIETRADNVRAAWFGGLERADAGPQHPVFPDKFILDVIIPQVDGRSAAGLDEALQVRVPGATVFLCGSGPAVGVLEQSPTPGVTELVQECFSRNGVGSRRATFHPSSQGARQWNEPHTEIAFARGALGDTVYKPTLIPV